VACVFGWLITGITIAIVAPVTASSDQVASDYSLQQTITRLLRDTLYQDAAYTILNPLVSAVSNPATICGYQQAAQRIPSLQSFEQSILLVWPHVVIMLAITAGLFALAYVQFMRQEVRA